MAVDLGGFAGLAVDVYSRAGMDRRVDEGGGGHRSDPRLVRRPRPATTTGVTIDYLVLCVCG